MAEKLCTNCGQPMAEDAAVCPSCGAAAPDAPDAAAPEPAGPEPIAADPAAAAAAPEPQPAVTAPAATAATAAPAAERAGSLATPLNFARGAKLAALLLFLLPWVTVSCQGTPLASASGLDLATGSINPISSPSGGTMGESFGDPNWLVLIGGLLIVGGLVASFVLARRQGALVGVATSVAALVLLGYEVLVGIRGKLNTEISASGDPAMREMEQQMSQMISVNIGIAFWLCLASLAAAAFFSWRVWSERAAP